MVFLDFHSLDLVGQVKHFVEHVHCFFRSTEISNIIVKLSRKFFFVQIKFFTQFLPIMWIIILERFNNTNCFFNWNILKLNILPQKQQHFHLKNVITSISYVKIVKSMYRNNIFSLLISQFSVYTCFAKNNRDTYKSNEFE